MMWLVDFNIGKTQFDGLNNFGTINVKIDGYVFDATSSLRWWDCFYC